MNPSPQINNKIPDKQPAKSLPTLTPKISQTLGTTNAPEIPQKKPLKPTESIKDPNPKDKNPDKDAHKPQSQMNPKKSDQPNDTKHLPDNHSSNKQQGIPPIQTPQKDHPTEPKNLRNVPKNNPQKVKENPIQKPSTPPLNMKLANTPEPSSNNNVSPKKEEHKQILQPPKVLVKPKKLDIPKCPTSDPKCIKEANKTPQICIEDNPCKKELLGYKMICAKIDTGVIMNRHYTDSKSWKYSDSIFKSDGFFEKCSKWKRKRIFRKQKFVKPPPIVKKLKEPKKIKAKVLEPAPKPEPILPICKTNLDIILNKLSSKNVKDTIQTNCVMPNPKK